MAATQGAIRAHLTKTVLAKVSQGKEQRAEALREFFMVSVPTAKDGAIDQMATMVPQLLDSLYAKWIAMFVERLFETVPMDQLELLCDGTKESDASIILVYLMFMESERMEKQVEDDLKEYGKEHSQDNDMGALVASYLRAKSEQLGEEAKIAQKQ